MESKDTTGMHMESHLKIWDPELNQTYVNKRCDAVVIIDEQSETQNKSEKCTPPLN